MLWSALRGGDMQQAFIMLALSIPAVVLCLSLHEAAHGGAAYLLGDRTARDSGRVTLSPLAHVDPWGFLCLLLFGFGWARPVPVNISNFKNRRAGMALTALAGPLANFITAFIAFCIFVVLMPHQGYLYTGQGSAFLYALGQFVLIVGSMSVGLGVFNLIPIHPLDGSRVLDAFMPFSWSQKLQQYQPVILLVFIFVLWSGWLDGLMSLAINGELRLALRFVSLLMRL